MMIEKREGHDWSVRYQFYEEPIEEMSVFGCITVEEAIRDARRSLNGIGDMNEGIYAILAVERADL